MCAERERPAAVVRFAVWSPEMEGRIPALLRERCTITELQAKRTVYSRKIILYKGLPGRGLGSRLATFSNKKRQVRHNVRLSAAKPGTGSDDEEDEEERDDDEPPPKRRYV